MEKLFDIGVVNVKGQNKEFNEDYHFVSSRTLKNGEKPYVFVIADGMGGYDDAEKASDISIERIEAWWNEITTASQSATEFVDDVELSLTKVLNEIDTELVSLGSEKQKPLGSTMSVLILLEGLFYIGHVGDGRIYKLNHHPVEAEDETIDLEDTGSFVKLTKDHSWAQLQIDEGKLSEEEAYGYRKSSLVTECLGVQKGITPFFNFGSYREGDSFLLCTDGLYKPLGAEKIKEIWAQSIEHKVEMQSVTDEFYQEVKLTDFDDDMCCITIN